MISTDFGTHPPAKVFKILLETGPTGQTGLPGFRQLPGRSLCPGRDAFRVHPAQRGGTHTFGQVSKSTKSSQIKR